MQPHTSPGTAVAHLLIHAAAQTRASGWGTGAWMQRLRARMFARQRDAAPPVALEIHDLQGHRVLQLADARPRVDVTLPPGTYHVSTQLGGLQRSYTITLERGRSFDLHLRQPDGAV